MDESLKRAAETGNIDALYSFIHHDANVFKRIDEMEFVDTPLHVAAVAGSTGFAMEMMNLKPSFARKLNPDGFSPLHLALLNQQTQMVIDFLSVDKDLIRVKGKGGFTVLHHVALDENYAHLLPRFLNFCPDCIVDLTVEMQTALHIAAEKNKFEAFKAMLEWIQSAFEDNKCKRSKILNYQDKDGNTVLHLAASINHPQQMIKLLIECEEVDKNNINYRGFTAMDVLQRQTVADNMESVNILSSNPSTFQKLSSVKILKDAIKEMRDETVGVLLIVFALVLTMTYQGVLSPPGSVFQGHATASTSSNDREGKSVMKTNAFLAFYIPNGVAFIISGGITLLLLESVAKSIMSFLSRIYIIVCFCYGTALSTIAPSTNVFLVVVSTQTIISVSLWFIWSSIHCPYPFFLTSNSFCSSMAEESKSVAITMQPTKTEYKLMVAAEHDDIDMLYQLIEVDTNVLHRMDKMDVVDTPLHMASSKGRVDFAMEMMYLKPSLAKKLNKEGLSPVHVALKCGYTELALSLLRLDKTLVGVKGRMGYTPLHYLVMYQKKQDDLDKFFDEYYPCIINDFTSQGETALHVAAKGNNQALKCLLEWLRKTAKISMLQKDKLLDMVNRDKETVLHVLARNQPDPQIVKLLSNDLRINTEVKNSKGQTALQILESSNKKGNVDIKKCMAILRHTKSWDLVAILRRTPFYIMAMIAQWGYEIKTMSTDSGNAMLVVTVLILTTSYQASLSPPGGVLPADVPKNNNNKFSNLQIYIGSINGTTSSNHSYHVVENIDFKPNTSMVGSSVLKKGPFLWFFIPNILAFSTSFLLTCLVIPTLVSGFFSFVLTLSLSTLLFCLLDSALVIISPDNQTSQILFTCVYTMVYITYLAIAFVVVPKMRKYVIS
ncbi:hypothetical protein J1N35_029343 [Gossypium stocksii]|uniref:PGG domain-containing protein n=1 Tax=Gossypium stocksii TaxID=47602 RepID=A0A9D3ZRZ2_9ROSI|nr:hypothetical protein J1N35_029343 [Gossypium stocksii]